MQQNTSNDPDKNQDRSSFPIFVGAIGADFQNFIWQQLADIQKSLGSIIEIHKSLDNRLRIVEAKVCALNRLFWIGMGIFAGFGGLAATAQPLVRLLLHTGVLSA